MNLVKGEIVEIYIEEGSTKGKIRVGGAFMRVPLMFLYDGKVGDKVLIESGIAISRDDRIRTKEN
jgi:hydrogenase maturation factor